MSDRSRPWWRIATPAVFVAAGTLLVTSAVSSRGTDLRPGRYANLADLAREQSARVTDLREEVASLQAQVQRLSDDLDDDTLQRLDEEADALAMPAGLSEVRGPGVVVTLDDAPAAVRDSAGDLVEETIVHQQDIQAVVNALWAGGAEAMTIQGQRVISTTGIKCVGNTVVLHGVPYSPPYVVAAIGDSRAMRGSLAGDPYIAGYLQAVEEWRLGWEVETSSNLGAPAYDGPLELRYAQAEQDPSVPDPT